MIIREEAPRLPPEKKKEEGKSKKEKKGKKKRKKKISSGKNQAPGGMIVFETQTQIVNLESNELD